MDFTVAAPPVKFTCTPQDKKPLYEAYLFRARKPTKESIY